MIQDTEPKKCHVQLSIDANMNPFIAIVAEKPLQTFVDLVVVKLKEQMEKQ